VDFVDNWIATVVAANNFGPAPGNLFGHLQLRDRQGRRFNAMGPGEFENYEPLLAAVRGYQPGFFGDRDVVTYAEPIEAGRDAFVLLVFRVEPDSEDLALVATR
jgi:hypothetical protein